MKKKMKERERANVQPESVGAARSGSCESRQRLLFSEFPLVVSELWLLLLLRVVTEVTGPLLLFICSVSRNLSEHGFRREFFASIYLPVAFKYRIFCCTVALRFLFMK